MKIFRTIGWLCLLLLPIHVWAQLQPHRIDIDDQTYDVLYQQPNVQGQLQALLVNDTGVQGSLLLLLRDERSVGHVVLGERRFAVKATAHGVSLQEVTEPPPPEPLLIDEEPALDDAPLKALGRAATDDNPAILDVLVLYTAAARNYLGSEQAMLDKIDLAIAEANQTYADSGIHAEVNLVHAMQVPFTETSDMASDLYRLRGDASIRSLREQYHADMVCLFNETTGPYAGIAFLLKGSGTDAYSIVQAKYSVGYFTFVHELGHNLGCSHGRDNASSGGAFSYSYGNRITVSGTLYRTVMAYAPGYRIGHFSSPLRSYLGATTGTATEDNARTINQRAPVIAAIYDSPTVTFSLHRNGTGPVYLNGQLLTSNQVQLNRGSLAVLEARGDFLAWTGAASSTNHTITLTMDDQASLTAHFADGTEPLAPVVIRNPISQNVAFGGRLQLEADGFGLPEPVFTWKRDGADLGISGRMMTLDNVTPDSDGSYTCELSNAAGSTTTTTAIVRITDAPGFTQQPLSQLAQPGDNVVFTAILNTAQPVTYQWYHDGQPIQGANSPTLTLSAVNEQAAGSYILLVTSGTFEVLSDEALLVLVAPPIIVHQPQRTVAISGDTAVFTVDVDGLAPINYQWRRDGHILPGQSGPVLVLSNVQPGDAAYYTVHVSNPYGISVSQPAFLEVYDPLVITTEPVDLVANVDETPVFQVVASGSAPVTYQWKRNGVALENQVYSICRLKDVQTRDAGIYTVDIKNPVGSLTSRAAVLTVLDPPRIVSNPGSLVVHEGLPALFEVNATGALPLNYQWQRNQTELPGETGPTLTLPSVSPQHAGSYSVRITNPDGSILSAAATLSVVAAPVVVRQPLPAVTPLGGTATFHVQASGTEPLTYRWLHNGQPVGGNSPVLYVQDVTLESAGSYRVVVSNPAGQATSGAADLRISQPPAITGPVMVTVDEGKPLLLQPQIRGLQPFTYSWRRNGNVTGTGAALEIPNATPADAGYYTLNVSNPDGSAAYAVQVVVAEAPRILTQPTSTTVGIGQTAMLWVQATGYSPLTYSWTRNGEPIPDAEGPTLIIPSVTASHAGNYVVHISNRFSSISSDAATLQVSQPPVITAQPESRQVAEGQHLALTVGVSGAEPMSFTWFRGLVTLGTDKQLNLGPALPEHSGSYSVRITNADGTVMSRQALVTVVSKPVFTTQPSPTTARVGSALSLRTTVDSAASVSIQWFRNGVAVTGANSASFNVYPCSPLHAGSYHAEATNLAGTTRSTTATVTIHDPPLLISQPAGIAANYDEAVSLTVEARGGEPLAYQWYKDGSLLTGKTGPTLSLFTASKQVQGLYHVVVRNTDGETSSRPAQLSVLPEPPVITRQPDRIAARPGERVVVSAEIESRFEVAHSWLKNDLVISTNQALVIPALSSSQAGTYMLRVSNEDGTTLSRPIEVLVATSPTITTQPADQLAGLGKTATFVVISDDPTARFQWEKNRVAISGANQASLQLLAVSADDEGYYTALVSNDFGEVYSREARLLIALPPVITQQPSDATVDVGGTATLGTTASGLGTLSYQWYGPSGLMPGATQSALRMTQTHEGHAGTYSCQVSSIGGTTTTRTVRVVVKSPPIITRQPLSQTVAPGDALSLDVAVTGLSPLAYQWFRNDIPLSGATTATLVIPQATTTDAGSYRVSVNNTDGTTHSAPAQITVVAPPKITRQPTGATIQPGSSHTLTVQAQGTPPLTYAWMRDHSTIATTTTLTLTDNPSLEGNYSVRITNAGGSVTSASVTVRVSQPPTITYQPAGGQVHIGQTFTLSANATGRPPLAYQWEKAGKPLPGETSSTLTLSGIVSEDVAGFRVRVSNTDGQALSDTAVLTLAPGETVAPGITLQPEDTQALRSTTTELTIEASGTPTLYYQWFKNNQPVAEASSGTLPITMTDDAPGNYHVVVMNTFGSVTSRVARVDFASLPGFLTQPTPTEGVIGDIVELDAQATNASSFAWIHDGAFIHDATNNTLLFPISGADSGGTYTLRAFNAWGYANSQSVQVKVHLPPVIQTHPNSLNVNRGDTATLRVIASSEGQPTYQWLKDGEILPNAINSSLLLSPVEPTHAGLYQVEISNAFGRTLSIPALVVVRDPPRILQTPSSVTIDEGAPFSLAVLASGRAPMNYTWVRNGSVLPANGSTLSVSSASTADAGTYSVRVDNLDGSAVASQIIVAIRALPRISTTLRTLTFNKGDTLSLSAGATGAAPLEYQWLFNGRKLNGENGATLTLPNLAASNTGTYGVRITNPIGTISANLALVTVLDPPKILQHPLPYIVPENTAVTLSVEATGRSPLTYQWYRNGLPLSGAIGPSHLMQKVTADQAGQYHVRVYNPDGYVDSQKAEITVITAPMIVTQPRSTRVTPGGTAYFLVDARGSTPLTYQWYHDGAPLESATESLLTIDNVQATDLGAYTVTVSNPLGSTTSTAALLTLSDAPVIVQQVQGKTVRQGETLFLAVMATGGGTLQYTWRLNNEVLVGPSERILTIQNVQPAHAGTYTVTVSNADGSITSQTAQIQVRSLPLFLHHPEVNIVTVGDPINLSARIASQESLTGYHWLKDGKPIDYGQTIVSEAAGLTTLDWEADSASFEMAGAYQLEVASNVGIQQSETAIVLVLPVQPLQIPENQPEPVALGLVDLEQGSKAFLFHGGIGYSYEVQSSSTLETWQTVHEATNLQQNIQQFIDSPSGQRTRFYRVMLKP